MSIYQVIYQCSICSKVGRDSDLFSSWSIRKWDILDRNRRVLCYRQQIVPIHQLILDYLAILTNATCINYYSPLCICFWIKQVVTFLTKVKRRHVGSWLRLRSWRVKFKLTTSPVWNIPQQWYTATFTPLSRYYCHCGPRFSTICFEYLCCLIREKLRDFFEVRKKSCKEMQINSVGL